MSTIRILAVSGLAMALSIAAVTVHAQAPSPPAQKDLRFVLRVPMGNLATDRNNPTCYSNVLTRPGPPGWGGTGWLPSGSAEQARATVESFKDAFIEKCRASGRSIEPRNFMFEFNQYKDGDRIVDESRPRYPEDVLVEL